MFWWIENLAWWKTVGTAPFQPLGNFRFKSSEVLLRNGEKSEKRFPHLSVDGNMFGVLVASGMSCCMGLLYKTYDTTPYDKGKQRITNAV